MNENIFSANFWFSLRSSTRVANGNGSLRCDHWCEDALANPVVARIFVMQSARLGDVQIDQYATSYLDHYWLEAYLARTIFVADGTAGQFDPRFPAGYYGLLNRASAQLKEVYSKKR
jgi:hypothetical protein